MMDVARSGAWCAFEDWLDEVEHEAYDLGSRWEGAARLVMCDPEFAAHEFMRLSKENDMARRAILKSETIELPTGRSAPVTDPWQYAYLITGEKKIGKTKFAIEGVEELVLQFDKPQMAYKIREIMIESWTKFKRTLIALEDKASEGNSDFPYQRIVIDGAGEWYTMCQTFTCKKFGVEHPSEEGYARAWHFLRDEFTDAVNRLLRLQRSVGCGMVFIAHSEWKEKKTRDGAKTERLVPNLPPRAEEILNGKCDAWFTWDYSGERRIMVVQGDEITGAGHRIDGHFQTPDGERIREIYMGESSAEALENFTKAFNNEQPYTTLRGLKELERSSKAASGGDGKKTTTRRMVRRA